jgi:hypothetical protein
MICIYCQEDKPSSSFTHRDHVLPQSFGRFENNFTLNRVVCDYCNQYFGDNLEITLARDTLEGVSRYEYGLRQPREFLSIGSRGKLVIKLADGPNKGAYVYHEYSEERAEIIIKPLPQVGILKPGSSEYEYFLLNQLPDKETLERTGFDLSLPNAIFLFSSHLQEIEPVLAEKGIAFQAGGWRELPLDPKERWLCDVERDIDDTICRAIAKIGFNYLAYWEGPRFAMSSDFATICRYIRFAEAGEYPLVVAGYQGLLADERVSRFRRSGHLITLNWASDGRSILAQVSLLNMLKYSICLARNYSGEHRALRRGHFFNIKDRKILGLEVLSPGDERLEALK